MRTLKLALNRKAVVGPLISVMIAVIIGMAVTITVVQDQLTTATTTNSVFNESYTFSVNATWQNLNNDHLVDGTFVFNNETDSFTEDTDYEVDYFNGRVRVFSSDDLSLAFAYNSTYDWRSASYVEGTTRTLLNILPVLLAVVLIVAVISVAQKPRR